MAKNLNISLRTLSDWKKGRKEVYDRLKWSYEVEELLKHIEAQNDDTAEKIKSVLSKRNGSMESDKLTHDEKIAIYTEYEKGHKQSDLIRQYDLTRSQMQSIIKYGQKVVHGV